MTQWIENPEGGRDRGPVAVVRAWVETLVRPRQFFRNGVAPGDQAPGLVFAMSVVLVAEGSRLALSSDRGPFVGAGADPGLTTGILLEVLWVGVAVLIVTPVALHLLAAVTTVTLIPLVADRAGVSETVQVLAYATAPCVFAGLPVLELRALAGLYGVYLLLVGIETVHGTGLVRSAVVGLVPAVAVFGYGFRAFAAIGTILRRWYVI